MFYGGFSINANRTPNISFGCMKAHLLPLGYATGFSVVNRKPLPLKSSTISSRSVTSCIAESWAKRRYVKFFINKITDAIGEEYETEVWLDYSKDCQYLSYEIYDKLRNGYDEVRKILLSIINNPEKWCK